MTDDLSKEKTLIRKDAVKGATRLGRYTLGKRLGVGGMAEVYLAEQDGPQQFRKRVVVKRILASLAADPQFVQMFVREAQVAARLSHGNVVQILELGEHTDGNQTEYFIAMEYIDGLTLQRLAQSSWDQGKAVPVDADWPTGQVRVVALFTDAPTDESIGLGDLSASDGPGKSVRVLELELGPRAGGAE